LLPIFAGIGYLAMPELLRQLQSKPVDFEWQAKIFNRLAGGDCFWLYKGICGCQNLSNPACPAFFAPDLEKLETN
jgi:hypothetical protein